MIVPPLMSIPLFITATLILRDMAQRSISSLTPSPSTLTSYSPIELDHLHELASTSALWCDSLIIPDPTFTFPLIVGLLMIANVEVSAKSRAAVAAAAFTSAEERAEDDKPLSSDQIVAQKREQAVHQWELGRRSFSTSSVGLKVGLGPGMSAAGRRRAVALKGRQMEESSPFQEMQLRVPSPSPQQEDDPEDKNRTSRIVTNAMRISAVIFIPIAAQAPAVRYHCTPSPS